MCKFRRITQILPADLKNTHTRARFPPFSRPFSLRLLVFSSLGLLFSPLYCWKFSADAHTYFLNKWKSFTSNFHFKNSAEQMPYWETHIKIEKSRKVVRERETENDQEWEPEGNGKCNETNFYIWPTITNASTHGQSRMWTENKRTNEWTNKQR